MPRVDQRSEPAVNSGGPESAVYTHTSSDQPEKFLTVLAITSIADDERLLGHIFGHTNWHLNVVTTYAAAAEFLAHHKCSVVLCERDLQDGSWRDVFDYLATLPNPPLLIVSSNNADEQLWAEVLNLGAYDVLMKPFDLTEVTRVLSLAHRNWRDRLQQLTAPVTDVGTRVSAAAI